LRHEFRYPVLSVAGMSGFLSLGNKPSVKARVSAKQAEEQSKLDRETIERRQALQKASLEDDAQVELDDKGIRDP
jgi:hypothetical protein